MIVTKRRKNTTAASANRTGAAGLAAARLKTQRAKLESSRRSDLGRGRLADPAVEAAADDAADGRA